MLYTYCVVTWLDIEPTVLKARTRCSSRFNINNTQWWGRGSRWHWGVKSSLLQRRPSRRASAAGDQHKLPSYNSFLQRRVSLFQTWMLPFFNITIIYAIFSIHRKEASKKTSYVIMIIIIIIIMIIMWVVEKETQCILRFYSWPVSLTGSSEEFLSPQPTTVKMSIH